MSTASTTRETFVESHPVDRLLRSDRLPHILCQGCGVGTVIHCYAEAIMESGIEENNHVCVSGIGCSGRAAGYVNVDSYHSTHGRAIPFAVGIAVQNPELEVTVVSGDGDLTAIGGNHFIHAARRNIDMNIICINNFNYGMTGGQAGPTTPLGARASTTPFGCGDAPFNLAHLARAVGACFVARWTVLHVRQLKEAISKAMTMDGFTFIEVLSPCPTGFGRVNNLERGMDLMESFVERCRVENNPPDLAELGVDVMDREAPIVVGNFFEEKREPFRPVMADQVGPPRPPSAWAKVRHTRLRADQND